MYCWLLSDDASDSLRDAIWEPLHQLLAPANATTTRFAALHALFTMAAVSWNPSGKEVSDLLEKVVLPRVELCAKSYLDGEADQSTEDELLIVGCILHPPYCFVSVFLSHAFP